MANPRDIDSTPINVPGWIEGGIYAVIALVIIGLCVAGL